MTMNRPVSLNILTGSDASAGETNASITSTASSCCSTTGSSVEPQDAVSKTASSNARSVYLETFGCQMNVLDSQLVQGQLRALGYRFTQNWKAADVILYNTCSVREQAENKVYSRIGEVGALKKERPGIILGVIGCMAERDGVAMMRRLPQVDLLCGPAELDKVPMLIDNAIKTSHLTGEDRPKSKDKPVALQGNTSRRSGTLAAAEDQLELLDLSRSFSPEEFTGTAYVRITRGCNKFCTYCVVPNTRGAEVHRSPEHILEECQKLADAGIVEITLLGQTVNHYHYDHDAMVEINGVQQPQVGATFGPNGPRVGATHRVTTFAKLLARIHDEIPSIKRLRFVTSFPRDFGDDILQTMAERPRICRYLHLPAQSGSNRMLKLMNRGYTVEEYNELLTRIRTYLPDAQLAGDIICGFPGESEEDHQATCDLLERARYKNCFIFKYSPRPGTAAIDRFVDDIPDEVKRRRNNELLAIQNRISREVHAECVGKTVRVFVESVSDRQSRQRAAAARPTPASNVTLGWEKVSSHGNAAIVAIPADESKIVQMAGRTDGDLIVCFDGDESLKGQIVNVKITSSLPLTLMGELVQS